MVEIDPTSLNSAARPLLSLSISLCHSHLRLSPIPLRHALTPETAPPSALPARVVKGAGSPQSPSLPSSLPCRRLQSSPTPLPIDPNRRHARRCSRLSPPPSIASTPSRQGSRRPLHLSRTPSSSLAHQPCYPSKVAPPHTGTQPIAGEDLAARPPPLCCALISSASATVVQC